ncbi:MAG: hypothetical protein ACTHNK_21240 [Thermomicrobiales bacterium]
MSDEPDDRYLATPEGFTGRLRAATVPATPTAYAQGRGIALARLAGASKASAGG